MKQSSTRNRFCFLHILKNAGQELDSKSVTFCIRYVFTLQSNRANIVKAAVICLLSYEQILP